jgi:hypothetical protein
VWTKEEQVVKNVERVEPGLSTNNLFSSFLQGCQTMCVWAFLIHPIWCPPKCQTQLEASNGESPPPGQLLPVIIERPDRRPSQHQNKCQYYANFGQKDQAV